MYSNTFTYERAGHGLLGSSGAGMSPAHPDPPIGGHLSPFHAHSSHMNGAQYDDDLNDDALEMLEALGLVGELPPRWDSSNPSTPCHAAPQQAATTPSIAFHPTCQRIGSGSPSPPSGGAGAFTPASRAASQQAGAEGQQPCWIVTTWSPSVKSGSPDGAQEAATMPSAVSMVRGLLLVLAWRPLSQRHHATHHHAIRHVYHAPAGSLPASGRPPPSSPCHKPANL